MTEKEFLEKKIELLLGRKSLVVAEINFKLRLLEEALALQKGHERKGKYGYRYEIF